MTENEIIRHLSQNPSYLKKGNEFLSNKFNVSTDTIKEIRMKLKDSNKQICQSYHLDDSKWEVKQIWKGPKGDSIQFKPKEESADYINAFKEFAETYELIIDNEYEPKQEGDLNMVLCLFDVHLGRLAHKKYVDESTDLNLQKEDIQSIVNNLLYDIPNTVKKITIPIGNDFFNVDNIFLQTTKGTPQQNTSDLHEMFKSGLTILANLAITMSIFADVELVLIPGNHDKLSSTYLAVALEQLFLSNKRISVDSSPIERKYRKLGNTVVGFAHGELKLEKYASLLPFEAREMFSSCKYFEYLLGDKHHEKIFQSETGGVVVRHVSGLARKDNWTYQEGYVLSTRRAYAIFYHETEGRCLERIYQL